MSLTVLTCIRDMFCDLPPSATFLVILTLELWFLLWLHNVFRSSDIDLWGHLMVVSWSPEWKLPLLMNHHILSHRPPPPPAAERRQDLISLGWNKKICWWKWSGDSLCCTRNHFWMTVWVCVCYHVAHCVGGGECFCSSHSFESAFGCMSIYTQRGQKDSSPPFLWLHTKQKGKDNPWLFQEVV